MEVSRCPDLSEYVSRWARWRLTIACVDSLRERARGRDGKVRAAVVGPFSGCVGVSRRTVERWLGNGVQSCNVNAERIVELALELCPLEARMILEEDLGRHREAVESLLGGYVRGLSPRRRLLRSERVIS